MRHDGVVVPGEACATSCSHSSAHSRSRAIRQPYSDGGSQLIFPLLGITECAASAENGNQVCELLDVSGQWRALPGCPRRPDDARNRVHGFSFVHCRWLLRGSSLASGGHCAPASPSSSASSSRRRAMLPGRCQRPLGEAAVTATRVSRASELCLLRTR